MSLTPAQLDDLVGPARKQVAAIGALSDRLRKATPDEKPQILKEARAAAGKLMGAAEELLGALK